MSKEKAVGKKGERERQKKEKIVAECRGNQTKRVKSRV